MCYFYSDLFYSYEPLLYQVLAAILNFYKLYTVWILTFAVLNLCGFRGSTAFRGSLVPRKFIPALTGQRMAFFDEQ